jgi:hypothetical protein
MKYELVKVKRNSSKKWGFEIVRYDKFWGISISLSRTTWMIGF